MRSLVALLALAACTAAAGLQPGTGVVRIYYKSDWNPPHFYYNPDGAGWVTSPGPAMKPSENSTFPPPKWWVYTIAANSVVFVMNNAAGQWDNNGGQNYKAATPGVFTLQDGKVSTVATYGVGCPDDCSGHGKCSGAPSYKCGCEGQWSGSACTCAPGSCGAHGECNSEGDCKCVAPWASCATGGDCGTDTTADMDNCGACGSKCSKTTGVSNARCEVGKCLLDCLTGFILCNDSITGAQSCHEGNTCPLPPLPGCGTFYDNQCNSDVIDTDAKYANRRWFTPRPGDADYREEFGDYWRLVGHTHVVYDSSHTKATVQVIALHKDAESGVKLQYVFDGQTQDSDTKEFTSATPGPISVVILGSDGAKLELQEVDFLWSAPVVDRKDGDFRGGQKGAIVEMFGWPHKDIEEECADLAKMGWAGVKVFPMQEQVMSLQPFNNFMNPWYFMYQPVSYRFEGRMGTIKDLRSMIRACRKVGVRVYADAVINHMVGSGNDANPHHRNGQGGGCTTWPNKNSSAAKLSPMYTQGFTYTRNDHTGQNPLQEFPAVPWGPLDFHCERALNAWNSALILDAGWLTGLVDLHTGRENVQERIADYLTSVLSIGFSGFRIDAAKHIKPTDLVAILGKLKRNMGGSLPGDFITWLEILTGGEGGMLLCDSSSGYNYGADFEKKFLGAGFSQEDTNKIKIWMSGYPNAPGTDCGTFSRRRQAVQNDDADQQNPGSSSRNMEGEGVIFIKTGDVEGHRRFEVKLFSNPNGASDNNNEYPVRLILSSYFWGDNGNTQGVPDGLSDCSLCKYTCQGCAGMPYTKAHDPNSCGYDMKVYTRTHRDKAVINAMRGWMKMSAVNSNKELGLPEHC